AMKFTFALDAGRVTDEQILGAIKKLGAKLGRPVRTADWNAWEERPCSMPIVQGRFGSWVDALRRAGLPAKGRWHLESRVLMRALEKAWRKLGRPPGTVLLHRLTGFSGGPYVARWGSIRRACEMLAAHKRGEITREALLNPIPPPCA